ncbi:pancreatic secretory granule membrane major glycoprotein GP2-like [Pyxicephalus adspersus]|uniref:pancreatic secretory granule membrane major glycoprotein GP2-like n=1 Tax=Pyxicephalus adspersus TaxID=30357 RepID=UPI003B5C4D26
MGTLVLGFVLALTLLIQHTGAECVYSWDSVVSCDFCGGSCDPQNGCYCSNGFDICLPSVNINCIDSSSCCPSGLYYSPLESCCIDTPICSVPCALDEVCNVTQCVCNSTLYADKTLADFHPIVTCDVYLMTVSISQCLLLLLGYDLWSIHLKDSNEICNFPYGDFINGQRVVAMQAQATSDWCGNSVMEVGSRLYVTNTINIHMKENITGDPISFPITCPYFSGTKPIAQTKMIYGVNGTEFYPLTMVAYKDPGFVTPYESDEMVTGSPIYVALYVPYTYGGTFFLRLQDCIASPSPTRSDPRALRLISGGCASDNSTTR